VVEVSPDNKPPVCKLMDYGKYKYEQQKKANEARKKQKVIEIKEIKMRPTIDEGDKVKVTLRFRGREMAHQHLGMDLLTRVQRDTEVFAKLEQYPKMEGRQMMMVLAPR
jgi:translation initiation factor IF-3